MPQYTNPDINRWFTEQVKPHIAMLRAWLRTRFPSIEVDDILQESYIRLFQARAQCTMVSPKSYLYAIARNLALDQLRKASYEVSTKSSVSIDSDEVLDVHDSIPEIVSRNQELEFLTRAIQQLPTRCRRVFTLRKIYNLSQAEIASRLNISIHTVSAQLVIGMHKCSEYFDRYRKESQT